MQKNYRVKDFIEKGWTPCIIRAIILVEWGSWRGEPMNAEWINMHTGETVREVTGKFKAVYLDGDVVLYKHVNHACAKVTLTLRDIDEIQKCLTAEGGK